MRLLAILAAVSLALSPVLPAAEAAAQSQGGSVAGAPGASGPVARRAADCFVPTGARPAQVQKRIVDGQEGADASRTGGPVPGPLAGRPLDCYAIPTDAVVAGALVILAGVIIGVLASGGGGDSNNSTNN
ncbi:MAG: hypothetical protein OEN23_13520 [Paracoccaceae bacterium]|nr:hypothetical protein [Paracoccaceae bacterium]